MFGTQSIAMNNAGFGITNDHTTTPFATVTNNVPFVTTKRRNPFGGPTARPKSDKRMKYGGANSKLNFLHAAL